VKNKIMNLAPLAELAVFPYEPPIASALILVLFFLFLGGSIGSFLNVVIYRVPAGLSIVKPRSRCPKCLTPILTRDNLPVIGWLMLRGRCRACKEPISLRYPTVEAIAGAIFAALAFGELMFIGATLPIEPRYAEFYPLVGICLYHFALLCGLGAAVMIVYDGSHVPASCWRLMLMIGFIPPLIRPALRPLAVVPPSELIARSFSLDRIAVASLAGGVGLALGVLLGIASWPASSHLARARSGHVDAAAMLGCVGLFLGWQAVCGIAVLAAAAWAVRQVIYCLGSKPRAPWQAYPAGATLVWILGWRKIVDEIEFAGREVFGTEAPYWLAAAAVGITFALSLAARKLAETAGRHSHAVGNTPA
jgi:leader peptidase (prepilin peptidase)/N-methyltransferase